MPAPPTNGADVAFTVLTPGPGVGPTTAKITSAKLAVKWKKSVPSGTLEVKGTTDSAANLTVTLRRVVASGTKPVKGWTVKRDGAGAFTREAAAARSRRRPLLPGNYRVDITGSSAGGKVPLVAKSLKLKGPRTGIAVDGYIAAIKNGAPATRLPGKRPVVWAMFTFAALPTKGAIRVDWMDQNGNAIHGAPSARGASPSRRPIAIPGAAIWPPAATGDPDGRQASSSGASASASASEARASRRPARAAGRPRCRSGGRSRAPARGAPPRGAGRGRRPPAARWGGGRG